jgi:hypothetical protein
MADVQNINETKEDEKDVNLDQANQGTDAANDNKPSEPEKTEQPGKVKKFFSKAGGFAKRALPYVGAAVAGAAVTAGAIVVAVCKGANEADDVPAIEKDEETVPADEFIEGEAEVIDAE